MTSDTIGAVIFDMDGVLVDSEPLHFAALNRMLAAEGHVLSEEENSRFVGTTLDETMAGVVRLFGLPRPPRDYGARYHAEIMAVLSGPLPPAPGVRPLLGHLRAAGLPLALASSSCRAWVEATLASLGVAEFFPVVICGDEVAHGKPHPEIFLRAAAALGTAPGRCLVVEDSPKGIAAAVAAGMRAVAVRTPFTAGMSLADAVLVLDSLEQGDEIVRLCLPQPHRSLLGGGDETL